MSGSVAFEAPDADGVAWVRLSNPGKKNALSVAMWQALRAGFEALNREPGATRVVVVRGADGDFAAGGDIEEFPQFRFAPDTLRAFHEDVVRPALQAMLDCDLPLLARIDGACIGGGLEIAACCDLRLAGEGSRFGVPIARLGFPLAPFELEVVAHALGPAVLRELLIEARVLDAGEALARGIVSRVVPDAELDDQCWTTARRLARELSPQALRLNKQALRLFAAGRAPSTPPQREPHYAYADSAEHREGLAAFNERRPPKF